MKLYKVEPKIFDYDQHELAILIAESEERAREMVDCFARAQYPLTVTEIDMTIEQKVVEVFNAG